MLGGKNSVQVNKAHSSIQGHTHHKDRDKQASKLATKELSQPETRSRTRKER